MSTMSLQISAYTLPFGFSIWVQAACVDAWIEVPMSPTGVCSTPAAAALQVDLHAQSMPKSSTLIQIPVSTKSVDRDVQVLCKP